MVSDLRFNLSSAFAHLADIALQWDMLHLTHRYCDCAELLYDGRKDLTRQELQIFALYCAEELEAFAYLHAAAVKHGREAILVVAHNIDQEFGEKRRSAKAIPLGPSGSSDARALIEFLQGVSINGPGGSA